MSISTVGQHLSSPYGPHTSLEWSTLCADDSVRTKSLYSYSQWAYPNMGHTATSVVIFWTQAPAKMVPAVKIIIPELNYALLSSYCSTISPHSSLHYTKPTISTLSAYFLPFFSHSGSRFLSMCVYIWIYILRCVYGIWARN